MKVIALQVNEFLYEWKTQLYRGECSKAGEAVSKTAWVSSILNRPCHHLHIYFLLHEKKNKVENMWV